MRSIRLLIIIAVALAVFGASASAGYTGMPKTIGIWKHEAT